MTMLPISADGQAIVLACTSLALMGDRSLKPLTAAEWHGLSINIRAAEMRPRDLIGLDQAALRKNLELSESAAERLGELLARGGQLALEAERLASRGIWITTRADGAYPPNLKQRLNRQAPPVLFGAGPVSGLQLPSIAILGSRDVDEAGIEFAQSLGGRCAGQGFAVVSGGARGVDSAAMSGAMEGGGPAIGITVDPLERLVSRRGFRAPIADELLTLATPFHPSARWQVSNAMNRNRIVYALSEAAVIVASSAEKGGTRSGALENLKAGWVPLHVRDDGTPGNKRLISEGATALPDDAAVRELEIAALAARRQDSLLDPEGEEVDQAPAERPDDAGTAAAPLDADEDAFIAVWPHLARFLTEPRQEREVATRLKLEPKQAREWLRRAVDEGNAEELNRPKRYVVAAGVAKQLRIDT